MRWIKEGAEYQPHWSLIAPVRPAVPQVENSCVGPQPDRQFRRSRSWKRPGSRRRRRPIAARSPAA